MAISSFIAPTHIGNCEIGFAPSRGGTMQMHLSRLDVHYLLVARGTIISREGKGCDDLAM